MNDARNARLYERPLARAHALAEQWADDLTPITRSEAARLLSTAISTTGWRQSTPLPLCPAPDPEETP
ncbi:hypothetical protein HUT19_22720 [Streptomyces sp. NA02950]|uniref:hypothetical protein n=1 Tax=Streptomyces sp. NA02950 TaxID=2742137 RepID=UPI0015927480|nr:hypothetical protein [Streptomyces sp. NA02950]QKV94224.1 hypothetical protein HUT19_22720 [Streptomyces sp. NA02950]